MAAEGPDEWQDWRESLLDVSMPAVCDDDGLALELNDELALMGTGRDELDDDDMHNDADDLPQHWYVFVPTGTELPELVCVSDPEYLEFDPTTHTPVAFGMDEASARGLLSTLQRPTTPAAKKVDDAGTLMAPRATRVSSAAGGSPRESSTIVAARAAVEGDTLGPTPLPVGIGLLAPPVPATAAGVGGAAVGVVRSALAPRVPPPTPLPTGKTFTLKAPAPALSSMRLDSPPYRPYVPLAGVPLTGTPVPPAEAPADVPTTPAAATRATSTATATAKSLSTAAAPDDSPPLPAAEAGHASRVRVATFLGLLCVLGAYRAGFKLDFAICSGLGVAAGHAHAVAHGWYDVDWRTAMDTTVRVVRAISRVLVEHFVLVCLLLLVFFLFAACVA